MVEKRSESYLEYQILFTDYETAFEKLLAENYDETNTYILHQIMDKPEICSKQSNRGYSSRQITNKFPHIFPQIASK
jgi:hypothetical protein